MVAGAEKSRTAASSAAQHAADLEPPAPPPTAIPPLLHRHALPQTITTTPTDLSASLRTDAAAVVSVRRDESGIGGDLGGVVVGRRLSEARWWEFKACAAAAVSPVFTATRRNAHCLSASESAPGRFPAPRWNYIAGEGDVSCRKGVDVTPQSPGCFA